VEARVTSQPARTGPHRWSACCTRSRRSSSVRSPAERLIVALPGARSHPRRGRARAGQDDGHQDARRWDRRRVQGIQFTPDLVPADLIGTRVHNQKTGEFGRPGRFTNLPLADETTSRRPRSRAHSSRSCRSAR
jgi:hypothetical protein